MRHLINRIISKPTDYTQCMQCRAINWYENESCIDCNSSNLERIEIDENIFIDYMEETFEGLNITLEV